jgi:AraC-like DNA-binding protein
MARIGGDRICESALTASSSMAAVSSAKTPAEIDIAPRFDKSSRRLARPFAAAGEAAFCSDSSRYRQNPTTGTHTALVL